MSCGESSADDSKDDNGDRSSDDDSGKNHGEHTSEGEGHTMHFPPLVRRHIHLTYIHHPHLDSKMQLLEQT